MTRSYNRDLRVVCQTKVSLWANVSLLTEQLWLHILVLKWWVRKIRMRLQKIVDYIVGLILLCCCQSWLASLLCHYSATLAKFDTIPSCSGSLSLYAAFEKFPFAQSAWHLYDWSIQCATPAAAVNLSTPDPAQCNLLFLFCDLDPFQTCSLAWPHFCRTQLHSPPNGDFCPRIRAS